MDFDNRQDAISQPHNNLTIYHYICILINLRLEFNHLTKQQRGQTPCSHIELIIICKSQSIFYMAIFVLCFNVIGTINLYAQKLSIPCFSNQWTVVGRYC